MGLGIAVRMQPDVAAAPGSNEKQIWNGAYGTGFFVDPKQKLVVFGTAAPGPLCQYDWGPVPGPVYGARTR